MAERAAPARDGWVTLGLTVSAISAAVSSFAGLRALAIAAGWHPLLAPLLPLTIDAYGMTATRVWLVGSTRSERARRFARANAIGAITMSLTGNATYHLVVVHLMQPAWPIVMAVGAAPALVLGLVSHLAVLRQVDPEPEAVLRPQPATRGPATRPTPRARPRPAPAAGDDLLTRARSADEAYRRTHDGRPISRDALRQALHIGGTRASELARSLRQGGTTNEAASTP